MIFEKISDNYFEDIKNIFPLNDYEHYKFYPSRTNNGWANYCFNLFENRNQDKEWFYYYKPLGSSSLLISIRLSKWDETHFGFKVAMLEFTFFNDEMPIEELSISFKEIFSFLQKNKVKFVSARINGDNLTVIHFLESNGFKYIENVIWPILDLRNHKTEQVEGIRLATAEDIDSLKIIASNFQYRRGHYHCDKKFDIKSVNDLYAKWVESSFERNEPIVVVENEGIVRGYFIIFFDENLSSSLGFKYGRMRSLALSAEVRGKGLGKNLFLGAINLMKKNGVGYIDSGYSTKNYLSAKLHTLNNFYSVYEEITLHKWL